MSGKNSVIFRLSLRQNYYKSLWKNIFLVSLHSFTSPLVRSPHQLPIFPSPTTCAVENYQRLRFGNSQSPGEFTGTPTIFSHPTSSLERLKQKSTFTLELRIIYPSMRSTAHTDISPDIKNTHIRPYINGGFRPVTDNDAILSVLLQHKEDKFSKLTVENRPQ